LPLWLSAAPSPRDPLPKMRGQRIEIGIETIAREQRQTPRSQVLAQTMDQQVGHFVRTWSKLDLRNTLGEGIQSDPQPQHLRVAAQAGAYFVHLHVRDLHLAEGALLQGLRVRSSPQEPPRDGRMPKSKHPFASRHIQSLG